MRPDVQNQEVLHISLFFVILTILVSCPADPPLLFLEHFELPSLMQLVVHNSPEIAISPSLVALTSSQRLSTVCSESHGITVGLLWNNVVD